MPGDHFDVIAERILTVEQDPAVQVIVRLARPEKDPDGNDFRCAYQVVTPGKQKIRYIYGVDEFQALQLAIVIIEAELDRVGQEHGWNLKFLGGNIGFARE